MFIVKNIKEYKRIIESVNSKSKLLYHGTIVDNVESIEEKGLIPSIGDFVKNAYSGSIDNYEDYLQELVFATDDKQIKKAQTSIIFQISNKLGINFHSVTNKDFKKHGALIVINDEDDDFKYLSEYDIHNGSYPLGVELGDYYTDEEIIPDKILIGDELLEFFSKRGLFPIKRT